MYYLIYLLLNVLIRVIYMLHHVNGTEQGTLYS